MAKPQLTLILPGLAVMLEQKINSSIIPTYLAKIIAKSTFKQDSTGLSRLLFNHFSKTPLLASDLPMVSLALGHETYLRADPCYLHADRDRLLLFSDMTDLSSEESSALIAEIEPLLAEFSGVLMQSTKDNWLLQLDTMPEVSFSALAEVTDKAVEPYLPTGKDGKDWIRLWSEIQMKLYASNINQQRIENNKLPVNSVWFWGAGKFEPKLSSWSKAQGESTLLKLLADNSSIPLQPDSHFNTASLSAGRHLWLADELNIDEDWLTQIEQFDLVVLQDLWYSCQKANITQLTIQIPNHGCYHLSPLDCWKFWK